MVVMNRTFLTEQTSGNLQLRAEPGACNPSLQTTIWSACWAFLQFSQL
jgi:hypothetical protein